MDELQVLYDELKKKEDKLDHERYYDDGNSLRKEVSVLRSRIRLVEFEQDEERQQWIKESIVKCENESEKYYFNCRLERLRRIIGLNLENTYIASLDYSTKTTELISDYKRSGCEFLLLKGLWQIDLGKYVSLIIANEGYVMQSYDDGLNMTKLKNSVNTSWDAWLKYKRLFDELREFYDNRNDDSVYHLLKDIQQIVDGVSYTKPYWFRNRVAFYNPSLLRAQDTIDRELGFGTTTNHLYVIGAIITTDNYFTI